LPSGISSLHTARNVPVFFGVLVLGATVALKLGVVGSHAAVSSSAAVSSTLHAVVHENNDIALTFDDGTPVGSQARDVPTIPAGTYTVRVVDDADIHDFHLVGPGVDEATSIDGTGSPTWTVTFQAGGVYRFVCDSHSDFMYGVFQASGSAGSSGSSGGGSAGGSSSGGSSGSSSSGSASSGGKSTAGSSTALRGTVTGTVGASGSLKLVFQGKAVSTLKSGRYRITIVDRTPARNFVVRQAKGRAITLSGVPFVGKRTATVDLTAGRWTFYTAAGKKSTGTFKVVGS
jgi:plastocyanin